MCHGCAVGANGNSPLISICSYFNKSFEYENAKIQNKVKNEKLKVKNYFSLFTLHSSLFTISVILLVFPFWYSI